MTKYTKTLLIAGVCAMLAMGSTYVAFGATSLDDAASKSQDNAFSAISNWFKKGVKIGGQDVGGVTQFNGTIINNTTTNGLGNPVTFGDDVRIDGKIWRGPTSGSEDNKPVQIEDGLTVGGSISQGRLDNGAVKALLTVNPSGGITRSVENMTDWDVSFTVERVKTGVYSVSLGHVDITERYIVVTPKGTEAAPTSASVATTSNNGIYVYVSQGGTLADQGFTLAIF